MNAPWRAAYIDGLKAIAAQELSPEDELFAHLALMAQFGVGDKVSPPTDRVESAGKQVAASTKGK